MSKDNFKDDFERNRQEIKPNQSEPTHSDANQDATSFDVNDEHQHFPPRNASRRHRKRDIGPTSERQQPSDNHVNAEPNEGQGKRPGILGGFVNKKQTSDHDRHESQSQSSVNTSDRGEKIRDYAKEDAHLKHENVRDDGRPEHHGGRHREQIHTDESNDNVRQAKTDPLKDSSSVNTSNQDAQHRTRNVSASPRDKHEPSSTSNDSQKLESQSNYIDDNHRGSKQDVTQKDKHTSQHDLKGKKVAAGAGAAGIAGAAHKHQHDKKQVKHEDQRKLNPQADNANHDNRHEQQRDTHRSHNGKKVAAGAGAAGIAGAAHKHQHDKKQVKHEDQRKLNPQADNANHDNRHEQHRDTHRSHNGKKVAAAAGVAGAAHKHQHDKKEEKAQKEHQHQKATGASTGAGVAGAHHGNGHDDHSNEKRGGCFKRILPLLAALLLLGALAIFGGMYLFNQGSDDNHNKDQQTEVAKKDNAKDKDQASKDKAADKDKSAAKDKEAQDKNASKDNNTNEDATSQNNDASQQTNQQNGVNQQGQTQQNPQNQQNQNQQNQAGGQSHTVSGNENLYRIAIRYYGNGSPENVEKIRRANGISGNNISNGQNLIIP